MSESIRIIIVFALLIGAITWTNWKEHGFWGMLFAWAFYVVGGGVILGAIYWFIYLL